MFGDRFSVTSGGCYWCLVGGAQCTGPLTAETLPVPSVKNVGAENRVSGESGVSRARKRDWVTQAYGKPAAVGPGGEAQEALRRAYRTGRGGSGSALSVPLSHSQRGRKKGRR